MMDRKRRAAALVVCVGVLAVLSLLAVSFARALGVERDAARSQGLQLEADLTALAGLEFAHAELVRLGAERGWDSIDDPWVLGALSGEVPADPLHPDHTRTYRLRIRDSASMIDLNGPRDVVRLQLVNLGCVLSTNLGRTILAEQVVDALLVERDRVAAFGDRRDLQAAGLLSADDFEAVAGFVTTWGRRDPLTVRATSAYADGTVFRARVQPDLERSPRAPVAVNTAPLEVLASNFGEAEGVWFEADPATPGMSVARRSRVPIETARRLAEEIAAARSVEPFATRDDFESLVDALASRGILDRLQAEVVKRVADPNVVRTGPVGKAGLVAHGCELAFSSGGRFEIDCAARVEAGDGTRLATSRVREVVDLYTDWSDRTFAAFSEGEGSSPDPAVVRRTFLPRTLEGGRTAVAHAWSSAPDLADGGVRTARWEIEPPAEAMLHVPFAGSLAPRVARGDPRAVLPAGVEAGDVLTSEGLHATRGAGVAYGMARQFPAEQGTATFVYRPDWEPGPETELYTLLEATASGADGGFYSFGVHVYDRLGAPWLLVRIYDPPAAIWEGAFRLGAGAIRDQDPLRLTIRWNLSRSPASGVPDPREQVQAYSGDEALALGSLDVFQNVDWYQPRPGSFDVGTPLDPSSTPALLYVGTPPIDAEVVGLATAAASDYPENGLLSALGPSYRAFRNRAVAGRWSSWAPGTPADLDESLYFYMPGYVQTFETACENCRQQLMVDVYGRGSGTVRHVHSGPDGAWERTYLGADGAPPLLAHAVPRWHGDRWSGRAALLSAEGFLRDLMILDRDMGPAWARAIHRAGTEEGDGSPSGIYEELARFSGRLPEGAVGRGARFLGARFEKRWTAPDRGAWLEVRDESDSLGVTMLHDGNGVWFQRPIRGRPTWEVGMRGARGTSVLIDEVTLRWTHPPQVLLFETLGDPAGASAGGATEMPAASTPPPAEIAALGWYAAATDEFGDSPPVAAGEAPVLPANLLPGDPPSAAGSPAGASGSSGAGDLPGRDGATVSTGAAADDADPGEVAPAEGRGPARSSGRVVRSRGVRGAADDAAGAAPPGVPAGAAGHGDSDQEEDEYPAGEGDGGGRKARGKGSEPAGYRGWIVVDLWDAVRGGVPADPRVVVVDAEGEETELVPTGDGRWLGPEAGFPAGRYEVVASAEGYEPTRRPVAVLDGKEARVEIGLR